MKTQAVFQWENTIVTLRNYIWVSYRTTYKVIAREEGNEGLPATSPGPATQLTPVALSLYLFPPFQCDIAPLSYLGTSVAAQCPSRTHTWHIWTAIYFWAAHEWFTRSSQTPWCTPVQIFPGSCGKGPEQPLQDPVGSCHAGHLARADPSHHPHGSISLSCTPCKSSLNRAGNYTPLCTNSELGNDTSETTKLKSHLEKSICWWSSLVNSL